MFTLNRSALIRHRTGRRCRREGTRWNDLNCRALRTYTVRMGNSSSSTLKAVRSSTAVVGRGSLARTARSIVLRTNDALILDEEPDWFLMGAFHNVGVVVWRRQPNREAMRRLELAVEVLRHRYPQGRSSIHVVVEGTQPATPEAQQAFVTLAGQAELACAAAVYLGSGFWASSLLSSSTKMAMRVTRSLEFRQHRTIEELADWLPAKHLELTGVRIRTERLVAVVAAFVRESELSDELG